MNLKNSGNIYFGNKLELHSNEVTLNKIDDKISK